MENDSLHVLGISFDTFFFWLESDTSNCRKIEKYKITENNDTIHI